MFQVLAGGINFFPLTGPEAQLVRSHPQSFSKEACLEVGHRTSISQLVNDTIYRMVQRAKQKTKAHVVERTIRALNEREFRVVFNWSNLYDLLTIHLNSTGVPTGHHPQKFFSTIIYIENVRFFVPIPIQIIKSMLLENCVRKILCIRRGFCTSRFGDWSKFSALRLAKIHIKVLFETLLLFHLIREDKAHFRLTLGILERFCKVINYQIERVNKTATNSLGLVIVICLFKRTTSNRKYK